MPLDLNFQEGTKIAFTCNGFGHVHLTGYLTLDEDFDLGDLEEEEDEDEEEEEQIPILVKNKRKAVESPKAAKKKVKKNEQADDDESSDDDDDDDDEMEAESDSDNDDSKLMDDDEVDSDESDDDEEDDDSDDESEDEVEKPKQKQKQNQIVKKQDKQKMVNGKEVKADGKQKKNKPEQQQQQQQQNAQQQQQQQKRRTIEGGVQIEDLKVGSGTPAKSGKNISVYYVGRLKNGKQFDETRKGEGFKFKLGNGDVIKGWDVGISGMKVGGKRRLTIPAAMA